MFIQSGAWDIILMIKNFFLKLYNLHFVLILTIFIAGLSVCALCTYGIVESYKQSCISQKEQEIYTYTSRMISQFEVTDFLNSTNDTINNELSAASEFFGGRILVVNSGMQVIFDSYERDIGKTVVMKEIVSAFNGENVSVCNLDEGYGIYSCKITDQDSRIIGSIFILYSMTSEQAVVENMITSGMIISTVIIIVLMFVSFIVIRRVVKPLKTMRTSLSKISAGNLDVSLEEKGVKEFREVSSSVNTMLVNVRATKENQQEFVSNVSHELKTPMASIKVLADSLLMQEGVDVELYREFLTDINEEIDRENEIISDLLTLVRMDKKADTLMVSLCSMNDILNIVLRRIKPLALQNNIEIIYESYRDIVAEVDDSKMIMALTNFCENAVKYNKELGQVRIGLNSDSQYVYITVEDTGIGIPEEAINHVFDRFYRVDKTRDRATGGTGLGLAIANEIITMHDGVVKVHSKEKVGTTFTIRIPLRHRTAMQ